MSEAIDISFCDTCVLRGEIEFDTQCAREALAFGQIIASRRAVVVNVDTETVDVTEPGEAPFDDYFTRGVVRCIASVSQGGRPIRASAPYEDSAGGNDL